MRALGTKNGCGIDTRIGMESGIAVLAPYQYHSGIAGIFAKPAANTLPATKFSSNTAFTRGSLDLSIVTPVSKVFDSGEALQQPSQRH
jgi:hypothetical protein